MQAPLDNGWVPSKLSAVLDAGSLQLLIPFERSFPIFFMDFLSHLTHDLLALPSERMLIAGLYTHWVRFRIRFLPEVDAQLVEEATLKKTRTGMLSNQRILSHCVGSSRTP